MTIFFSVEELNLMRSLLVAEGGPYSDEERALLAKIDMALDACAKLEKSYE